MLSIAILPLLIAFLSTLILTPVSLHFIKKIGLFDDPKKRHHPASIHKVPIPRGGGIPLFLGVFLASALFLPITQITISIFAASLIALLVGILDDKFDISPYARFFINISCAIIIVANGITIPFITNPIGGIINLDAVGLPINFLGLSFKILLSNFIAIIWIVWVMNMLNWSKGVDGQMPGIVAISAVVIGILSLRFATLDANSIIAAKLSFIIAGSALAFLVFNFYPAKIFPGYGATSIYLLLTAVSILSTAKLATAILVMGVPMVDGMFTIIRRILSGRSPFWHDNKHLHHLLLRMGLGQRRIALFYWIFSAILGALSLSLESKGKMFAIIMLVVLMSGALLFLHLILKHSDDKNNL